MTKDFIKRLLLSVLVFSIGGCNQQDTPRGEEEIQHIQVGIIPDSLELNGLIILAEELGYFQENGLKISFEQQSSGVSSLNNLEDGTLDLALSTEYVFAKRICSSRYR